MSSEEIGELLDDLQKRTDRCKVMFEQYFLGIQKTPPLQLQRELERKIRQLTQTHITNTGLRFRFTTLSQKFVSYNTYWKRTLRQIENGSYIRDIAKLGRDAVRLGKDVPNELLAKMPKRMRERILRDREAALERAKREDHREHQLRESGVVRENKRKNEHRIEEAQMESLEDLDLDSIFSEMQAPAATPAPTRPAPARPAAPRGRKRKSESGNTDVDKLFAGVICEPSAPASARQRVARPSKGPPPVPQTASPPPPGMSVAEAQSLYTRYKKARELVGQDTSKLNYNRLMKSLNKQVPKIAKQYSARTVKFDVVVKGDQVILKAKPEK